MYCQDGHSFSVHMPIGMKQTNNAAELMAALRALNMYPTGKIATYSDCEYLLLGVRRAAKRRKIKGWVNQRLGEIMWPSQLCSPFGNRSFGAQQKGS